jgi:hydroxyacylglutathione hydrolase
MSRLQIEPIPCLRDNYAYLIRSGEEAWLVDPSEVAGPRAALAGLTLRGILATHHHIDHVGGIEGLVAAAAGPIWVAAHASDRGRVPAQTHFIDAPSGRFIATDRMIGGRALQAMWIPGHTLGAIAWYLPPADAEEGGDVFTGDTLFAGGCGRLFEGTSAQMHASLQALTSLPATTRLWFGHEYTVTNLRFAALVEPENPAIRQRQAEIGRAATAEVLGERRAAKDTFRG